MSSNDFYTIKQRIPFKHIDKINSSIENLAKIQVDIQGKVTASWSFKVNGDCPAYISSINTADERLKNVDIRYGDYIMSINEQNVCRASAKSVNKLLKSNNASLKLGLCRSNNQVSLSPNEKIKSPSKFQQCDMGSGIKSLISCFNRHVSLKTKKSTTSTNKISNEKEQEVNSNDTIDYGYYSIQTGASSIESCSVKDTFSATSSLGSVSYDSETNNKTKSFSSLSSVTSISSIHEQKHNLNLDSMKYEIENFLNNMQLVIDVYVRPSAIFKILSVDESLILFQNIEKLVPITRFILNMINSYEQNPLKLPNVELLKVVFDSFKTYLLGLPKATSLLGELAVTSDVFMDFLEKLNDHDSFKIFDYLFMPLKFTQILIEFMQDIQRNCQSDDKNDETVKLKQIVADLYHCSIGTHQLIKNVESPLSRNKKLNCMSKRYERIGVEIIDNPDGDHAWKRAFLVINETKLSIECPSYSIDLKTSVTSAKMSTKCNVVYMKIRPSLAHDVFCMAVKVDSSEMKNFLFNSVSKF